MRKPFHVLLTEDQERLLRERAVALGFCRKSDYVRFVLFMRPSLIEKIDQIYERVCGGER